MQNHRTGEENLQRLINEAFTGQLSVDTLNVIHTLARPLDNEKSKDVLVLKATNRECKVSKIFLKIGLSCAKIKDSFI